MNTTHRTLWNASLGAWVAVSEIATARGKRSSGGVTPALACLLAALAFAPGAWADPGDITSGGGAGANASIYGVGGSGGLSGGGGGGGIVTGGGNGGTGDTGGAGTASSGAPGTGAIPGLGGAGAAQWGGGGGGGGGSTPGFGGGTGGGGAVSNFTAAASAVFTANTAGADGGIGGQWAGGGGGGSALVLTAAGAQFNTQGFNGTGGSGGGGNVSNAGGGGGGVAVVLSQGGTVTNASGSQLTGGAGGTSGYGGGGGAGVFLVSGGTLLNNAAVAGGGAGNGGHYGTAGGNAAQANRGLIDNLGTLIGGLGSANFRGGTGGHGVLANATAVRNAAGATIAGGVGGGNTSSSSAFSAGSGGDGVRFITGQGSLDNAGSITGGNTGAALADSALGSGGAGVRAQSDGNTLINSGAISGGLNTGGERANAVSLEGNNNTLELRAGYSFTGNVVASGTGNVLRLGGAADATLNLATGLQYQGFASFEKIGATTWTVSGTGNTSHVWNINAGTLTGDSTSLQGNITNNAAVNFDQAATGTYAGVMSGTGSFSKLGAGNLILTGINTYNGATSVNAGTLSVNGSISNSAVTVNNGGVLGGSGTVGNTSIASGGVLAPGNSIGTLTVNGNLSFAAGSIYRVEVDAAGANDRINATGTATINGGTVDVQAGAGTYAANTQYTILNAAGGRTGNFAGVTSNLAFLTPTLAYDVNNVFLSLARNDVSFASVAITPNQIATSTAFQNAGNTGDMGAVQTALTGLSAAQARAAYDSTSGSGIVALRRAGAGFAAGFGSQLQARLGAQANAAGGFANSFTSRPVLLAANDHLSDLMAPVSDSAPQKFSLAGGASSLASSPDAASKGLWVRGFGGHGNTHANANAAASDLQSSGLSVGFDSEVKDGVRVGVAATGGTSRLSTDNNESGKTRNSAIAVYGSYASGPWNFSGSASMGWGKNHLDRNVTVGALNRVASSDFDSSTLSAYGEAAYSMPMNGWTLQPLAGLSLSRNKADGFTETGAGALNLQVAEQTINSSKVMLGAKASFDAGRIRFEPRVIWAHEFGDLNTPMTAQFQG
ncbi:MAG: autotransporter domain-containing protein, partial [Thermomonas sp.]